MIAGGSQQLRLFRRAIRDGATLEQACAATGDVITPAEGRFYIAQDSKTPPPPEAFQLLFHPDARAAASQPQEAPMASAANMKENGEGAGISGEYKRPDAARAFEIYDKQIAPKKAKMDTIKGDLSQPYQDIKDEAHFPRKVLNFITSIEDEEEAKRDHLLLALSEGLRHRKLFIPDDLVSRADGTSGNGIVPGGTAPRLRLATLPMGIPSDGSETDLADAAGPDDDDEAAGLDDFEEASEEELAAQADRKGRKR